MSIITALLPLIIIVATVVGFVAYRNGGFVGLVSNLFAPARKPIEVEGLMVQTRSLIESESEALDPTKEAMRLLVTHDQNLDDSAHHRKRVTEYTVTLPPRFGPLAIADAKAARLYRLKTFGSPATTDAAFNGEFYFLSPANSGVSKLLQMEQVRTMLTEISQKLGAVMIQHNRLIFRDVGSQKMIDVEVTMELISQLIQTVEFAHQT